MLAEVLIPLVVLATAPGDTIRVGDASLVATLAAGVDTVDNYVMRDGDKQLVVTFVQTITEVPDGYLVVQDNQSDGGVTLSLDSIVVAHGTLATVWHGDVTPIGARHVEFSPGRMAGVAVDTLGQEEPVDVEVPPGLFDFSIMTLVVDRLPLSVGYKATVATFDITRAAVYVPIEVMALETIQLNGSTFEAWKIDVDLGQVIVTRWVERDTRQELKWSFTFNGREMTGERRPG